MVSSFYFILIPTVIAAIALQVTADSNKRAASEWTYDCVNEHCQKTRVSNGQIAVSLSECHLSCSKYASIWPMPTGTFEYKHSLVELDVNSIDVQLLNGNAPIQSLVDGAAERFKNNINLKAPQHNKKAGGHSLIIKIDVNDPQQNTVVYEQDESYTLKLSTSDNSVNALINAQNFFGARHGLETLSQIIIYNDIKNEFQMPDNFYLEDKPVYHHRGILLDTSRNYMSVDVIKRTLEGMAASKLNLFHWHITDSHSFPYVSQSLPELSHLGAYSPSKIYSKEVIADIIEFAKIRGVKVMPEFDAPAHVGEGWQNTDYVVCFDKKPWQDYCVEPPCGQFNPTKDGLYDYVERIYLDMVNQFDPDIFHMGGDEVSTSCWESEQEIVDWMKLNGYTIDKDGFMKLWDKFQSEALFRFNRQRGQKVPIIMWTSELTSEDYFHYLPNDTYIIQIWTTAQDAQIKFLLENGYRTILSNYDALYMDCGFAGWVDDGHNWCSPYVGWHTVYDNSPAKIAGNHKNLMMGAESVLWSEQTDEASVDTRLWPRAAAMAERLWAEPTSTWKEAENRLLIHRERLVRLRINADQLEPEWCRQHQGSCPVDGPLNQAAKDEL